MLHSVCRALHRDSLEFCVSSRPGVCRQPLPSAASNGLEKKFYLCRARSPQRPTGLAVSGSLTRRCASHCLDSALGARRVFYDEIKAFSLLSGWTDSWHCKLQAGRRAAQPRLGEIQQPRPMGVQDVPSSAQRLKKKKKNNSFASFRFIRGH